MNGIHFLATGLEREDGTLILAGYDTSTDMSESPHTLIIAGKPGELEEIGNLRWKTEATQADASGKRLIFVGEWGNYLDFASLEDLRTGVLDDDGEIEYRSVARVGEEIYACGGSRTIVRLTESGWSDISEQLAGGNLIEAVTGFPDEELYGFGWNGEIWLREEDTWASVDSPTELILQAACTVEDRVFVGGQLGVILEGRHHAWKIHEHNEKVDIWSACEYDGVPYFSSIQGILRLVDGKIERMDTSALKSTMHLFNGPSGLWSIAGGTLGVFDGLSWRCVDQID